MYTKPIPGALSLLALCSVFRLTTASLSLQELQPIANFPASCEAAYKQRIQSCPEADTFPLTGPKSSPAVCSKECFNALQKAIANIQANCQGTSAPPGTVIAHAFSGDLSVWLCNLNNGGGSPPASTSNSAPPASSSQSASISPAPISSTPAESSPSPSSTKSSSNLASADTSVSSNSQPSTFSSSSSQTRSQPSASSASSSAKSTAHSPSSSSTSSGPRPTQSINNGSPFDQVVPNTASGLLLHHGQGTLSLLTAVALAIIFS